MKIFPIGHLVKTNPIKANQSQSNPIKANKMPKQTQNKPNTNPIKPNFKGKIMLLRMTINTRHVSLCYYPDEIEAPKAYDRLTKIVCFIFSSVVRFIDSSLMAVSRNLNSVSDILTETELECREKCLAATNSRFWRQVSIDKAGIFL